METVIRYPLDEHVTSYDHVNRSVVDQTSYLEEHALYPCHEEDSVPTTPDHYWENAYIGPAIRLARPDLWVFGDTCLYWEKGARGLYRAPDVTVVAGPPPPVIPRVYLAWSDRPLLFVLEVRSNSTEFQDTGPKQDIYERKLKAPEYLYTGTEDTGATILSFWRLIGGVYVLISPDENGRVWSEQLGLGFGFDDSRVFRVYTSDGEPIPTLEEAQVARAQSEAARAQSEAARAQSDAARVEAERQTLQETTARMEAEARAQAEAAARVAMEERMAQLMAEVEHLKSPTGAA